MYWVGADIAIKNAHPLVQARSTPNLSEFEQRIDTVLTWLQKPEEERPGLVMLYFEEPDGSGHHNGPRSSRIGAVVQRMDSLMGVLRKDRSPSFCRDVNLIVARPRHDRYQR